MNFDLLVKDNFIPDADALRADVLAKSFETVKDPAGLEYTGIQFRDPKEFEKEIGELVQFPVKVRHSVARINYKGELPENAIHPDLYMGEFAGILYLTPPDSRTGTAFWLNKAFGHSEVATTKWLEEHGIEEEKYVNTLRHQANCAADWHLGGFIAAKLGRFITYPTKRFHSRYPFAGFGDKPENARLIIAIFYDRA